MEKNRDFPGSFGTNPQLVWRFVAYDLGDFSGNHPSVRFQEICASPLVSQKEFSVI